MNWLQNSPAEYSLAAKLFHWITAVTVVGLFAMGFWMVDLTYYDDWYQQAPELHISIGMCLALLTALRLGYRSVSDYPPALARERRSVVLLSKLVHGVMLLTLLVIFVSGYFVVTAEGDALSVFSLIEIPAALRSDNNLQDTAGLIHEWAAYLVMGLAALHGIAALYHHFWIKDATLSRMVTKAPLE